MVRLIASFAFVLFFICLPEEHWFEIYLVLFPFFCTRFKSTTLEEFTIYKLIFSFCFLFSLRSLLQTPATKSTALNYNQRCNTTVVTSSRQKVWEPSELILILSSSLPTQTSLRSNVQTELPFLSHPAFHQVMVVRAARLADNTDESCGNRQLGIKKPPHYSSNQPYYQSTATHTSVPYNAVHEDRPTRSPIPVLRTLKNRLVWTKALHMKFLQAVNYLGLDNGIYFLTQVTYDSLCFPV